MELFDAGESTTKRPQVSCLAHAIGPGCPGPTGVLSCWWISRPKKYPTAVNEGTVSGVVTIHSPVNSPVGALAGLLGTLKCRIWGKFAARASPSAFLTFLTTISIFDCPEQSQTCPTSTSAILRRLLPETVSSSDWSGALDVSSDTRQLPLASAVASRGGRPPAAPVSSTRIFSPGSALPHTGTLVPRCRTIWSENRAGTDGAALAKPAPKSRAARARVLFMGDSGRNRGNRPSQGVRGAGSDALGAGGLAWGPPAVAGMTHAEHGMILLIHVKRMRPNGPPGPRDAAKEGPPGGDCGCVAPNDVYI
jgi:hypothetical protein